MASPKTPVDPATRVSKEISDYVSAVAQQMGLEMPSATAARIGLQLLQVGMGRIQEGIPLDGWLTGLRERIPEYESVMKLYQSGKMPLPDALAELRRLNGVYLSTVSDLWGFPPEFIQDTGVYDANLDLLAAVKAAVQQKKR